MALLTISDDRPDAKIKETINQVVRDAQDEWRPQTFEGEYPTSGIGISELRPQHVATPQASDYHYWEYTIATAVCWVNWINTSANVSAYLICTGIFNLTTDPSVTEIFPTANGHDLPYMNVEQIYANEACRGWFSRPFTIKPSSTIKVQVYGKAAQVEKIGMLGYCIGKRSYLITKA